MKKRVEKTAIYAVFFTCTLYKFDKKIGLW